MDRKTLDRIHKQIWKHKSSEWDSYWWELASVGMPSAPIYLTGGSGQNSGGTNSRRNSRRNNTMLCTVAMRALNVLGPGLLQGLASPSRPWFQGGTSKPGLMNNKANEQWLHDWADTILASMDRTNYYSQFELQLKTAAQFGTGTKSIFKDNDRLYRVVDHPIGSYGLAQDEMGELDTFTREREMTLRQIVGAWGEDALPDKLRRIWTARDGNRETLVKVCHAILPNGAYTDGAFGRRGMRWGEHYWLPGGSHSGVVPGAVPGGRGGAELQEEMTPRRADGKAEEGVLFEGGYRDFPVSALRWSRSAEEVWGTECPGMSSLPDVYTLQDIRRDILNASKLKNFPPLNAADSLSTKPKSLVSAAVTHGGLSADGRPLVQALYVNPQSLAELRELEREIGGEVEETYLKPLFLAFLGDERNQRQTAREADEKARERLSLLGPLQERVADDVSDKDVNRISNILVRASLTDWANGRDGELPLPPEELMGETIDVHYVSEVAQAQKAVGLANIDRIATTIIGLSEVFPEARDKLNVDEMIDEYANKLSAPPQIVYDMETANAARQQRAQQQAAMAAVEAAPGIAKAAKDVSEIEPAPVERRARLLA